MTEQPHTEFAMAAVDFAGLFNQVFEQEHVSGFRVQLTKPDGPSTGGGIQALQHITLIHPGEEQTIVIGGCNNVEKRAELRHYDLVEQQFHKRFHGDFPIERNEFNRLQEKLADFFKNQLIQVSLAKQRTADPIPPTSKSSKGMIVGIVISLVVLAVVVLVMFTLKD